MRRWAIVFALSSVALAVDCRRASRREPGLDAVPVRSMIVNPAPFTATLGGWGVVQERFIVDAEIPAPSRGEIHPGTEVRIGSGSGRVESIGAPSAGGVVPVMIRGSSPVGGASGAAIAVSFVLHRSESAIQVPQEALTITPGGESVYVLEPYDVSAGLFRATRVHVRTGGRSGNLAEIMGGLDSGARVVIGGAEYLDDGALSIDTGARSGG